MAATITEVSLVDRGRVVTAGSGSSGSSGHTIQNPSGTDMTARAKLQFKGADVSDDSTNNRTVVDMSYTEINYEDWLELTEQEKETGRWDVVGVPGADGTVSFDLMTKLWENPDPTQAMAADTEININDTDYDLLAYVCFFTSSNNRVVPLLLTPKNKSAYVCYADSNNSKQRRFDHSDGKVTIKAGYVGTTIDNNMIILYQIYGIKLHKTVEIKAIAPEVSTSASKCMMSDGETSVEEAIVDVNDRISANSISASTTITLTRLKEYTTLADGYFSVTCSDSSYGNYVSVVVDNIEIARVHKSSSTDAKFAMFVRKGSIIKFSGSTLSSAYFLPLS